MTVYWGVIDVGPMELECGCCSNVVLLLGSLLGSQGLAAAVRGYEADATNSTDHPRNAANGPGASGQLWELGLEAHPCTFKGYCWMA